MGPTDGHLPWLACLPRARVWMAAREGGQAPSTRRHAQRTSAPCPVSDLHLQRPDFCPSVVTRPDPQISKREGHMAPAGQGPRSRLSNGFGFPAQSAPPTPPVLPTEGLRGCTGAPRYSHTLTPGPPRGPVLGSLSPPTPTTCPQKRKQREKGGGRRGGHRTTERRRAVRPHAQDS